MANGTGLELVHLTVVIVFIISTCVYLSVTC